MPHNRFFIDTPFKEQTLVTLREDEFRHLKVMRIKPKDIVELVNGKSELALGSIETIGKAEAEIYITDVKRKKVERSLILGLSILRFSKMELVFEKGTELGVTSFWIFPAKLSEKKMISPSQQKRIESLLIASIKQCGRLDLPEILIFDSLKALPSNEGHSFLADTRENASPLIKESYAKNSLIIVGPEKGLTKEEVAYLEKKEFKGVSLSKNILRAETAAITSAAIALELSSVN